MTTTFKYDGLAIIFLVADLERTRKFYSEVLGLSLSVEEGYMTFKMPGVELVFFQGEPKPGSSPQIVFGLEQGGIDTLAERLVQQGVQLVTPVSEAPGGWSVEYQDPDGHSLAFYQAGSLPRSLSS